MSFIEKFKNSSKELSNVKALAVCAMMLAVRILLGGFANFTLAFLPFVKIGFNFLPVVIVAFLYGPVCAAIVSGAGDILASVLANPTSFSINPGIFLCCILEGLIYGVILYGSELRIRDIALAEGAVVLLCRLPLNTLALCILMEMPYLELLLYRSIAIIPLSILEGALIIALRGILLMARKKT